MWVRVIGNWCRDYNLDGWPVDYLRRRPGKCYFNENGGIGDDMKTIPGPRHAGKDSIACLALAMAQFCFVSSLHDPK